MVYVARTYDKVQRVDEMAAFCSDVLERAAASELASYSSGVSATSGMSSPMSPQATAAAAPPVSGLLLCFQTVCLHVVEAPTRVLMAALRELNARSPDESLVSEARVVAFTEDVPRRMFDGWRSAYVPGVVGDAIAPDDTEASVELASATNLALLRLGEHLGAISDNEADNLMANLKGMRPDLLPAAGESLLGFLASDDSPNLDEFMSIYDEPIDVDLDSERVWPLPKPAWHHTGLVG